MGSSHSKQGKEISNGGKCSPSHEKHTSANSTTPLAANAAQLACPQTPVMGRHVSFDEKLTPGRNRTRNVSGKSHSSILLSLAISG